MFAATDLPAALAGILCLRPAAYTVAAPPLFDLFLRKQMSTPSLRLGSAASGSALPYVVALSVCLSIHSLTLGISRGKFGNY